MPNRLTDTTIWKKQKWFKKLPPLYKLAWKYLTDECDHAGFWKVDLSELLDDLGLDEFDFEKFLVACNQDFDKRTGKGIHRQRIMKINDAEVWVTGFIQFQYANRNGKLFLTFNAARSAIELLKLKELYVLAIDYKYICLANGEPLTTLPNSSEPFRTLDNPSEPFGTVLNPNSISISNSLDDMLIEEDSKEEIVVNNSKSEKKTFPKNPTDKDLGLELPEKFIQPLIQFLKINKAQDKTVGQIKTSWEFFKVKRFDGINFYDSPSKIYEHFLNTAKSELNGQQSNSTSLNGSKPSRIEALKKW